MDALCRQNEAVRSSRPCGRYAGRDQHPHPRPWELLPAPVVKVALRGWGALPSPVRRALVPLGRVVNPGHTTTIERLPGPSTVPGVEELRAEGFTPIEELTGFAQLALVWPEEHRRAVAETREWWLEEPLDGQLWLVRSPWPGWTLDEVFSVLWPAVDQHRDLAGRLGAAAGLLRESETQAHQRLVAVRRSTEPS